MSILNTGRETLKDALTASNESTKLKNQLQAERADMEQRKKAAERSTLGTAAGGLSSLATAYDAYEALTAPGEVAATPGTAAALDSAVSPELGSIDGAAAEAVPGATSAIGESGLASLSSAVAPESIGAGSTAAGITGTTGGAAAGGSAAAGAGEAGIGSALSGAASSIGSGAASAAGAIGSGLSTAGSAIAAGAAAAGEAVAGGAAAVAGGVSAAWSALLLALA